MKPTGKAAYKVVRYILEKKVFTQREICRKTGASLGGVNYVVRWLHKHRYIAREKGGYRLAAAGGLLSLFSIYRKMDDLKIASFDVDASRKAVLKLVKERGAVLCLTTALQQYDAYFRDPSICVYADEKFAKEFENLPKGYTHVEIYRDDLKHPGDVTKTGGFRATTETRTAIDLFCSNWAYAAEGLVRRKWKR